MCCHPKHAIFWVLRGARLTLGLGRTSVYLRLALQLILPWLPEYWDYRCEPAIWHYLVCFVCLFCFVVLCDPETLHCAALVLGWGVRENAVPITVENSIIKYCLGYSRPSFVFWKLALQCYRPFSFHLCNWCPQGIFFLNGLPVNFAVNLTAYRCSEMSLCFYCQSGCILSTRGPQKIIS